MFTPTGSDTTSGYGYGFGNGFVLHASSRSHLGFKLSVTAVSYGLLMWLRFVVMCVF